MSAPNQTPVDLIVRSHRIMLERDEFDGGIGITGERIVGLYAGNEPPAKKVLDVGNKVVIPGLIDSHVHLRDPGFTQKEDFEAGTAAAALGGVTTVMDMPNVDPPTSTLERFLEHIEIASAKSHVDFGHNAAATEPDQIQALAEAGATAFKIFMMRDVGRDYPHMPGTMVDDHGRLYELFCEVAKTGKTLLLHPHDQSLWEKFVADAWARDGRGPESYSKAWSRDDGIIFNLGVSTAIELQAASGVALHLLHTNNRRMLDLVANAKRHGQNVTTELNPHCLYLGTWENIQRLGPYALGIWVPDAQIRHLWEAIGNDEIDVIATDHAPHTREEKDPGWKDMFAAPGGSPSLQEFLPLLLTSMHEGRLTLRQIVDMCATRPAQRFGLYPVKGVIREGADADLTVLDLDKEITFADEAMATKNKYTCYAGRRVRGVPVTTIVRGTIVADDGQVLVKPGFGQFVHARLNARN